MSHDNRAALRRHCSSVLKQSASRASKQEGAEEKDSCMFITMEVVYQEMISPEDQCFWRKIWHMNVSIYNLLLGEHLNLAVE